MVKFSSMKLEVKPGTIGLMMTALQLVEEKQLQTNKRSGSSFFIKDLSEKDLQTVIELLTEAATSRGISVQCITHPETETQTETSSLTPSKP